MFNRKLPAAAEGWPLLSQNSNNMVLEAPRYLTPKRALFGKSVFTFMFGLAVLILVLGLFMFFSDDPSLKPGGILLTALGGTATWMTRSSRHEDLARSWFGKQLTLILSDSQLRIKGGLKNQVVPLQPGFSIKLGLSPHPQAAVVRAETHGATTRQQLVTLNKKAVVYDQSFIVLFSSGSALVRVAEIYGQVDAQRLVGGIQIIIGKKFGGVDETEFQVDYE